MENKQTLEILQAREYAYTVEITNANSKFESQITIKVRSDEGLEKTAEEARRVYELELKKLQGAKTPP